MADRWQARPDRPTVVPMLHVRIEEQLDRLKREPAWQSGSRNAITVTKEPSLQVVSLDLPGNLRVLGFVTRADFSDAPSGIARGDEVAVYLPMSYQVGGYTVFVPKSACIGCLMWNIGPGRPLTSVVIVPGPVDESEQNWGRGLPVIPQRTP